MDNRKLLWGKDLRTPVNYPVKYTITVKFRNPLIKKLISLVHRIILIVLYIYENFLLHRKIDINSRFFENTFAIKNIIVYNCHSILDLGSAESDFPLCIYALGKDVTAFDYRDYPFTKNIKGNILKIRDESKRFGKYDCITSISTIEHIGLGAYEDPVQDIDIFKTLQNILSCIKNGGLFIITLPITSDETFIRKSPYEIVYNYDDFRRYIKHLDCDIVDQVLIKYDDEKSEKYKMIPSEELEHNGIYMVALRKKK